MKKPYRPSSPFYLSDEKDASQFANPKMRAENHISPATTPDPEDYDWIPVPRRRRHDGWAPAKQRKFIETLADTGSVSAAAREVGMSNQSCYRLRRSKEGAPFAAAWDAAIGQASRLLADVAFDRALNGTEHHVTDKEGNHIYTHYRTNDRLLMFLLRSHQPQIYGQGEERREAAPNGGANIADAVEKLEPRHPEGADAEAAVERHLSPSETGEEEQASAPPTENQETPENGAS